MSTPINFGESRLGNALFRWWDDLKEDRATRASLRRCATLTDIVLDPAYQRLYRELRALEWPAGNRPELDDRLAAIAGLLVFVEEDVTDPLPIGMSASAADGSDRPIVSELRFRDLLRREGTEEIFDAMRRVLPLLRKKANVRGLANDVYYWGDSVKRRWAYEYRWPIKKSI